MTEFQRKVYNAVKKIPRGKVLTYKEVARLAGRPKAFRAVGSALNKNPAPFGKDAGQARIPCHRVIRSDGRIGGYARGQKEKIKILKKEGYIKSH